MNILHLSPYAAPAFPFGGVVRALDELTRALARRGHTVNILTTDALAPGVRVEMLTETNDTGVNIVRVRNLVPRGTLNLSSPLKLRQTGRALLAAADVVHVHEFRTVENLLVVSLAARLGKPLVLSPHGTLTRATGRGTVKKLWDTLISPGLARHFTHLVGLSADELDEAAGLWERWQAASGLHVVPNGVDADAFTHLPPREQFREQHGVPADARIILFLGRVHPRKGAHVLAQAFRQLDDLPDVRLVIAGGDEGGLALTAPFLSERVIVTGYLEGAARLAALSSADVFVLPAVGEGMPMAALEALAAGVPAVLSPECHLPEVEQAGAGVIVPVDAAVIANTLRELLDDAARRLMMGDAGRRLVRERFTWDTVAALLESVYRTASSTSV